MFKIIKIVWLSFLMAMQELKVNKLRTFLSLFGITIGIFCIIGVLATLDSLEAKVQNDIKSFGDNTIYIDKWQYSGGNDYPWWKYLKRPEPKFEELKYVVQKSTLIENGAFFVSTIANVNYLDNILKNVNLYGITEKFNAIQTLNVEWGRYFNEQEFERGISNCIIGNKIAEDLFGNVSKAIGKQILYNGKRLYIIGVLKKIGSSFVGGFNYDESILLNYTYFTGVYNPKFCNPFIIIKAKKNVQSAVLSNELTGIMRQIRRLKPNQEDDFSCNDVAEFSNQVTQFFGSVKLGGWAIAGLSLLVGMFGVANIMFVTVRERRSQIGLKKALGAKRKVILAEFLIESAFLCIIGGLLGLSLVWILTLVLNSVLPFHLFIATSVIVLALTICIILGMIAGFLPASAASKMNPVEAIRSN